MSDTALSTCHLLRAPASEGGRLLRGDASGERHLLYGCTVGIADVEFTYEVMTPTPVGVAEVEFAYEVMSVTSQTI